MSVIEQIIELSNSIKEASGCDRVEFIFSSNQHFCPYMDIRLNYSELGLWNSARFSEFEILNSYVSDSRVMSFSESTKRLVEQYKSEIGRKS